MKTNLRNVAVLLAALTVGTAAVASDHADKKGYVVDSSKEVVRSGFGLCWKTGTWSPADAIAECDGDLVKPAAAAPTDSAAQTNVAPAPSAAIEPTAATATAAAPVAQKVTYAADTFFDFDKAVLTPAGKAKLEELVGQLQGTDLEVIVATGHTDATGSDAYNLKLSMRRAKAVKAFLVSKGIPESRVFTEGKGERQPVADNRTREGRAKNRRVEVEVIGTRK